ncbi:MAG: ABC transporter substrate-binding protein, partial [Patescibacteria group bacterium]
MLNPRQSFPGAIANAVKGSSRTQKSWLVFWLCLFLAGIVGLLWQANERSLVEQPAVGGTLREGIIGAPRFVNPLLAISNPDRDLTALVYSGLLRLNSDCQLVPDLDESYRVSDDVERYTFILKPDLTWHDGRAVTTDDVVFTITQAKNPTIKSPRRASWEGVEVEKISDREVVFILKQPYPLFLENVTIGLLPAHLWQTLAPEAFPFSNLNLEGVGTGPYQIESVKRDADGLPIIYELSPFKDFSLGQPQIKKLLINFYANEEDLLVAYQNDRVDALSALPPKLITEVINAVAERRGQLVAVTLPRVFAVFFNQNQAKIFTRAEVRTALNLLVDRQEIIDQILAGHGQPLNGPLPTNDQATTTLAAVKTTEQAAAILTKQGWKKNETTKQWEHLAGKEVTTLAFSLSTADTPELKATAMYLKELWEKFGAAVEVKIFEAGALNQNVIRPRDYEALLFGEIVGRQPDLYSFWHSSQRLDPGLNVALYANITVDKILSELRNANPTDQSSDKQYQLVAEEIAKDVPAIFLYSPDFIYLLPSNLKGV